MSLGLLMVMLLAQADHLTGIHSSSRNTIAFVESKIQGEEWAPYRVVEPQRPADFTLEGPGRMLLRLRTGIDKTRTASAAVVAVVRDDQVILSAKVEPELDPEAKLIEDPRGLSEGQVYLLWIEPGTHKVSVRYSGGAKTLVLARYTRMSVEELRAVRSGRMLAPPPGKVVPSVGPLVPEGEHLRAEPEARPSPPQRPRPWFGRLPKGEASWDQIYLGKVSRPPVPPRRRGQLLARRAQATLQGPSPLLLLELSAGAALDSLGGAPIFGAGLRLPLAEDEGGRLCLSAGLGAQLSILSRARPLRSGEVIVGAGRLQHTEGAMSAELHLELGALAFARPYFSASIGALLGRLAVKRMAQEEASLSAGPLGGLRVGLLLWGGPFVELRGQVGALYNRLVSSREYFAGSLQLGYRFSIKETP